MNKAVHKVLVGMHRLGDKAIIIASSSSSKYIFFIYPSICMHTSTQSLNCNYSIKQDKILSKLILGLITK